MPHEYEIASFDITKPGVPQITDINPEMVSYITPADANKKWTDAHELYINQHVPKVPATVFIWSQNGYNRYVVVKGNMRNKLMQELESIYDEMEKDGYESIERREARKERERREAEARHIMEEAKEYLAHHDRLMTKVERYDYLKTYNRINNEGGEGYLPEIVCQEEYDEAIKYLGTDDNGK